MRYGIPILSNRVAPRSLYAESLHILTMHGGRILSRRIERLQGDFGLSFIRVVNELRIDTLICGGISRSIREALTELDIKVIENVTGTIDEIVALIQDGKLKSTRLAQVYTTPDVSDSSHRTPVISNWNDSPGKTPGTIKPRQFQTLDCITCQDRVCLRGVDCLALDQRIESDDRELLAMLETSLDISAETERQLCRLTELVYYCLDMKYRKIGIAFCIELIEPTEILTGLLRRFFDVHPVCCKIGGVRESAFSGDNENTQEKETVSCNPILQAEILNRIETDFNIIVGLCIGVDSIFAKLSKAPVTTLFVKDRSLANNPIGAVYSDYYLKEAAASLSLSSQDDLMYSKASTKEVEND